MFELLIEKLKYDPTFSGRFDDFFSEKEIPARTLLLREGEISRFVHYVEKGCLRQWVNKDGKDITCQFFFEGQPVASIDSFMSGQPSLFNIETIEPSVILSMDKEHFGQLRQMFPEFGEGFQKYIFQRFRNYAQLFLSRIKDTPRERYEDLIKNHPEIIKRVPQHYIASYLGITPISLSRIRNRK